MNKQETKLVDEIARKQVEIIQDLELLKTDEYFADIEAIQIRQAEIADEFAALMAKETEGGEN